MNARNRAESDPNALSGAIPYPDIGLEWDAVSGRGDSRQRYRIYRLCPGETEPELISTCDSEAAVGVALCQHGRDGEFDPDSGDCSVGVLDTMGEVGRKWIFRPWLASPGNVSTAGKVLRTARADVQPSTPAVFACNPDESGGVADSLK